MEKQPIDYQSPGAIKEREIGDLGAPQKTFDTIIGPNLRLRDNLIQLVACVAGAIIGAPVGWFLVTDHIGGLVIGAVVGVISGVFLSGIGIGVYRFIKGVKSK